LKKRDQKFSGEKFGETESKKVFVFFNCCLQNGEFGHSRKQLRIHSISAVDGREVAVKVKSSPETKELERASRIC